MVYIPFPRQDHDNDADLAVWRLRTPKRQGDWTALKSFLAKQSRLEPDIHSVPKCWYSELPQGDNLAIDVEHFRPKNQASPLDFKRIKVLEKKTGFKLRQDSTASAYSWLEFDCRNYRLVTAITNRGGAKHIYFPIVERTARLTNGAFVWTPTSVEYPYFLDPTNRHDASLLLVNPNGEITPRSLKTDLTDADLNNLPHSWQSDGFNYMRAEVTIQLYRLNDKVFQRGKKEVFDKVHDKLDQLGKLEQVKINYQIDSNDADFKDLKASIIRSIILSASPSAPFALAARCALQAYLPLNHLNNNVKQALEFITRQILDRIDAEVDKLVISWENQ